MGDASDALLVLYAAVAIKSPTAPPCMLAEHATGLALECIVAQCVRKCASDRTRVSLLVHLSASVCRLQRLQERNPTDSTLVLNCRLLA